MKYVSTTPTYNANNNNNNNNIQLNNNNNIIYKKMSLSATAPNLASKASSKKSIKQINNSNLNSNLNSFPLSGYERFTECCFTYIFNCKYFQVKRKNLDNQLPLNSIKGLSLFSFNTNN